MSVLHAPHRTRAPRERLSFDLQPYEFVAPLVFDQARLWDARITKSSIRFDRIFGSQREMRSKALMGRIHQVSPNYTDRVLLAAHPFDHRLMGLGFFFQTLGFANAGQLEGIFPSEDGTRLIAYVWSSLYDGRQVAEAVLRDNSFELDVFDLDEASPWNDIPTFVLDVTPR